MKWPIEPIIAISKRCLSLLYLGVGLIACLSAQDIAPYERLRSVGPIPADFLEPASIKYIREIRNWQDSSRMTREAMDAFFQEDYYYLNQLLRSGKVLFGDPLSQYVSRLADRLLAEQPELRQKLRFYTLRSTVANAFTTSDGIILVNAGLVAKLQNEAQLAFVLSHEISHFVGRHPIEIYLSLREKEADGSGLFRRIEAGDLLLARNNYSQEKEQEADLLGLNLYLQAGYDPEALEGVFDILELARQPFGERLIDRSLLETPYLRFSNEQWISQPLPANTIVPGETPGTHPRPDDRRANLLAALGERSTRPYTASAYQPAAFEQAQRIAQYELCQLYQIEQHYESAFYCAYVLRQQTSQPNAYLDKQLAYSLYALAKYTNAGRFWDVHQDYNELSGPAQQIAWLMEHTDEAERSILALSFGWRQQRRYPDDPELRAMNIDLMQELGQHFVDSMGYFLSVAEVHTETNWVRTALADLLDDPVFFTALAENLFLGQRKRQAAPPKAITEAEADRQRIDGFSLGLDSVVFINPTYQRLDKRKESQIQFLESEIAEQYFTQSLENHARSLDLNLKILRYDRMLPKEIETFNDMMLLNEWMAERNLHDRLPMVSILHEEVAGLTRRYGTQYVGWTQAVSVTKTRPGRKMMLWMGLFPPLLPYSMYYVLTPDHNLYFYTVIYDIERGEYLIIYPRQLRMKDRRDVINSVAYDLIFQISQSE